MASTHSSICLRMSVPRSIIRGRTRREEVEVEGRGNTPVGGRFWYGSFEERAFASLRVVLESTEGLVGCEVILDFLIIPSKIG